MRCLKTHQAIGDVVHLLTWVVIFHRSVSMSVSHTAVERCLLALNGCEYAQWGDKLHNMPMCFYAEHQAKAEMSTTKGMQCPENCIDFS